MPLFTFVKRPRRRVGLKGFFERGGGFFVNAFPVNYLVCFINLFLVPAVSLLLFCRRGWCPCSFSLVSVLWYAVFVVANVIVTRVFVVLLMMGGINVFNDGAWYTILAVASALLIVFCVDFFFKCREIAQGSSEDSQS